MTTRPGVRHAQTMRATPSLVAYAHLLAADAETVEQAVRVELARNPLLRERPGAADTAHETDCAGMAAEESWLAEAERGARCVLDRQDHPMLAYLCGCIDASGYLRTDPAAVAVQFGAGRERVERVRQALRTAATPGVGARDPAEFWSWQLADIAAEEPVAHLARRVVADHLESLARGELGVIALRLGVTRPEVAAAHALIRDRLLPRPPVPGGRALPARPDVLVVDSGRTLVAVIPESQRIGVEVDAAAREIVRASATARLREQLAHAASFCAALEQRWATMRRVAQCAVDLQKAFVRRGPEHLRRCTRAEVAVRLGLHESTVSRAVAGRHVLLPDGRLVAFADFFHAALPVKHAIRAILAAEDRPISDAEIAAALAEHGHAVARRTVAKYRAALGIKPVGARR